MKINFKNINKMYEKKKIVIDTNILLKSKKIINLLGSNGSGKSTIIKIVLNIIKSTENKISYFINKKEIKNINKIKNIIGYMPQNPKFPGNLKTEELINLFEELKDIKPIFKNELIESLNINSFINKKINQLSHGMVQKINILQAFMFNNLIYILDEPTAGVDEKPTEILKNIINKKKKNGGCFFFTSHIKSDTVELSDINIRVEEGIIKFIKKNDKK